MLGLGSQVKGHITRRFGMPWSKPAQRMKDYVGAMRACWRAWQNREPLNFQSEHYNLSLMTPNFAPPPLANGHIPVMIAAVQERMLQVAGEVCEGVRLHGIVTRQYIDQIAIPNLKKGFAKSGKPKRNGTTSSFPVEASCASRRIVTDLRRRLKRLSRQSPFMVRRAATARVLSLADGHGKPRNCTSCQIQQKWPEMAKLVNEEIVHAFAAAGTYADIASVIKKRFAGINRLNFEIPVHSEHDRGVLKEILQDLHRT